MLDCSLAHSIVCCLCDPRSLLDPTVRAATTTTNYSNTIQNTTVDDNGDHDLVEKIRQRRAHQRERERERERAGEKELTATGFPRELKNSIGSTSAHSDGLAWTGAATRTQLKRLQRCPSWFTEAFFFQTLCSVPEPLRPARHKRPRVGRRSACGVKCNALGRSSSMECE